MASDAHCDWYDVPDDDDPRKQKGKTMSYEGYEEWLCVNGHRSVNSCYHDAPQKCDKCGEEFEYCRSVDTTNGFDSKRHPDLELKEEKICEHCNSIVERIYHKPVRGWKRLSAKK